MYRHAFRTFAVAGTMLVAAAACTDLVVEPKSDVTAANVFNDPASYRSYLAKLYAGLAVSGQADPNASDSRPDIQGIDAGFSQYLRLLWQMQELPTDEAVIAWGDGSLQELNTQGWSSSNEFLSAMYSRIFFQVGLANEFLRETTDAKLQSRGVGAQLRADIQQYRAEARFLRALSYSHGIDLFGDIPLVRETDALGVTPTQSTRAELFNYVVEELNAVRAELPVGAAAQYGRASQGAVDMLLAKLYLNAEVYTGQARYADARTAAERVIASNAYRLDDKYQEIFLADNHTSPELIFAVPQDGKRIQSYGGTTFLTHASVGGAMDPGAFGLNFGWWGLRVRPQLVELFPAQGDARASILWREGQSLAITSLTNFTDGFGAPKYRNVTSTGAKGSDETFSDVDYPMFRLADAYLTYAEAVLRGGGGSRAQALGYVNQLRQRAFGGATGNVTDAQLTLDLIRDERARELFWEGHRRTDLIRFNRFSTNGVWAFKGGVPAGRTTEAFRNLYPLPASELLTNPNLKQNPGY